jgi:uncharacterized protein (TIGR00369 family)
VTGVRESSLADRAVTWGEPRSKTITWHDPLLTADAGAGLSGLEFLRSIRDGILPPPPMAAHFGLRLRDVEVGRVVFECEPDESAYNPIGMVHGGLVCTLADSVAGCAVHSTLESGLAYTSIDLNVSYLRAVTSGSGTLVAVGVVTKPGRRVAFAAVEIHDGQGKLVATASSSCLVMDRPST